MELEVFVSKKGTKVVTASNLHQVLELPKSQYAANLRKWLSDVYEFRDGIRKPRKMKDYAERRCSSKLLDDYYLTVELAKLITLNSRSKKKQKYARHLLQLEDQVEHAELFTKEQVLALLDLARVMGLVSCQQATEARHLETYKERNGGRPHRWWEFRASLLGYSRSELEKALRRKGRSTKRKNLRELLFEYDKYEMVRMAVIDLFMALGKSERYAKNMGDLAKIFARELRVEIFDDREEVPEAFLPPVNKELVEEIKGSRAGRLLTLWSESKCTA